MSVSRNKTVRILLLGWLFVIASSLSHSIHAQDVAPKVDEYMNAAMRTYHFSGTVLLARDGSQLSHVSTKQRTYTGLYKIGGVK